MGLSNIEIKKELSRRFQEARRKSRPRTCLLCNKPLTKLCNSHSVPQFVLKNLADAGKVMQSSYLMSYEDIDLLKLKRS